MPRTYADTVDAIEQLLQDTGNATFKAADINYEIEQVLREIVRVSPHILEVSFSIESRRGTATSTSANNLVDSDKSQFVSGDSTNEKVIHNETKHTYAVVTSYSSTSQVGLSKDIMTSGDAYRIYNKRCRADNQLYIGDMFGFEEVIRAEYRVNQNPRQWRSVRYINPNVLEIGIGFTPDDSNASQTTSFVEVILEVAKEHVLCQLIDLDGLTNATGSAGDTSIAIDAMGEAQIIEKGNEFYLAGHATTYVITANVTVSSNAATINFYPPLESAIANNSAITFVGSTLTSSLEDIVVRRTAGRLALHHSSAFMNTIPVGGDETFNRFRRLGIDLIGLTDELLSGSPPKTNKIYPRF